jgi:hypothetical protein
MSAIRAKTGNLSETNSLFRSNDATGHTGLLFAWGGGVILRRLATCLRKVEEAFRYLTLTTVPLSLRRGSWRLL